MIENTSTTYGCEICGHPWSVKEFAQRCEAIGYPENYDKLLGKWVLVPTSVYFSKEIAPDSFDFSPKKLWRAVRIDSNYITNLLPNFPMTTGSTPSEQTAEDYENEHGDKLLALHHRLVVTCKGFEDNSRVESLKQCYSVPESMFEWLNSTLVEMELSRAKDKERAKQKFGEQMSRYVSNFFTSHEFENAQHELAEKMLEEIMAHEAMSEIGELPEIPQEEQASITMQINE